jgi:hypothetical protein
MTDQNDPNTLILLGEIRGQLRELIHNGNNNSAKLDALGIRVAALENKDSRRDGAAAAFASILKSPVLAWIITAAGAAWAILTGKVSV